MSAFSEQLSTVVSSATTPEPGSCQVPDLFAGAFHGLGDQGGFQPKAGEVDHQLQLDVALADVPGTVAGGATA